MKNSELDNFVEKSVLIEYVSDNPGFYEGKIHKENIWSIIPLYHLVFKSHTYRKNSGEPCIKTIFLNPKYLRQKDKRLICDGVCPIWTYRKNESDRDYVELNEFLNKNSE